MKSIKIIPFLLALANLPLAAQTEPNDTTGVVLDEVVVQGRTQRVVKYGVEYIPSKKVKKAAYDAPSLLFNMQIPQLNVSPVDFSIQTSSGSEVSLFIDYVPASMQDLQGLRPDDVLRVEVLDYPQDPRFMSAQHVVNFIMKHYEWGGYTKLSAFGSTLDDAMLRGSAYDKFVYKKWTFDASVSSDGMWRNKYKGNKTEILRNVAVGDGYYDEIMRKSATDKSKKRMNDQYAAVRAAYNGDKSYISHTLSYARTRVPNSYKNISTSFSDDVLPSSMASDINNSQSIAAAINGYYVFALSGGNTLMVDWSFSHSGNRRNTLYRLGTQPSILNGNKESVYTPGVTLFYSKNLKHNNTLRTMLSTHNTFYDTEYRGSYDGEQKLTSSEEMLFLEYMQSWNFGLSLYSRVGASYVLGRVNGVNEISEVGPRLGLQLQYSINAKSTVGLEAWWANSSPQASTSNSAIVQSNEVMWLQGNPNLENAKGPMITATYNYYNTPQFSDQCINQIK